MNKTFKMKWILVFLGIIWSLPSLSAELKGFSWQSSSNYVGDKDVEYTFEYTISTDAPYTIFYALAYSRSHFDSTAVGNPIDLDKVSVTINGSPATINASSSYNYGSGMYIRLIDPSLANTNDQIKVTIKGIEHGSSAGTSNWRWIRTASGGGHAIDEVSSPAPIVLQYDTSTPEELVNFSWQSTSNLQSINGVTYTFEYELVTPEPYSIFHAQAYQALNTTELNNPINISRTVVTIDGQPATLDTDSSASYNLGTGVTLRLQKPSLATAGSTVKVVLHDIKNGDSLGSFNWQYINTAKRSGHPVDEVSLPNPIVLVADSNIPPPNLASTQFNSPSILVPNSQSMGSWAVIPVVLTNDQEKSLLVSHYSNGTQGIASVLNNSDGTFSQNQFQTGDDMGGAYGLTYGDVNADGLVDAISAGPNGDNYTFINEGTEDSPTFSYGYKVGDTNNMYFYGQRIGHGDLDQDGALDIVWAGSGNTIIGYGPWFNGQYSSMTKLSSTEGAIKGNVYGVILSDIDSDGDDDIIKIRGAGVSDYNGGIQILINNLNRDYTEVNFNSSNSGPVFSQANVELNPIWGETGDFDNNGTQDIIFFNGSDSQGKLFVGLNSASTGQTPQFTFHSIDLDIYRPRTQNDFTKGFVADINNDGFLDIITSGYYTKTAILLGRGDGTFELDRMMSAGQIKAVDDIDFNGALDLVLDTYNGLEVFYQDQVTTITDEWENSGGQDADHTGNDHYTFVLTKEQYVTIELATTVDSHMYLINQDGIYITDIDNTGSHSTFSGTLPPGTYEIVSATHLVNISGTYDITISATDAIDEVVINNQDIISTTQVLNDYGDPLYNLVEIEFVDRIFTTMVMGPPSGNDNCKIYTTTTVDDISTYDKIVCKTPISESIINYEAWSWSHNGIPKQVSRTAHIPIPSQQVTYIPVSNKLKRTFATHSEFTFIDGINDVTPVPRYYPAYSDEYLKVGAGNNTACIGKTGNTEYLDNMVNGFCGSVGTPYGLLKLNDSTNKYSILQEQFHAGGYAFSAYEHLLIETGTDKYLCYVNGIQGVFTKLDPNHCVISIENNPRDFSRKAVFTVAIKPELDEISLALLASVKRIKAPCLGVKDGEILLGNIFNMAGLERCALPVESHSNYHAVIANHQLTPVYFDHLQTTQDLNDPQLVYSSLLYNREGSAVIDLEQKPLCRGKYEITSEQSLWYWGYYSDDQCVVGTSSGVSYLTTFDLFSFNLSTESTEYGTVELGEMKECVVIANNSFSAQCPSNDTNPRFYMDTSEHFKFIVDNSYIDQLIQNNEINELDVKSLQSLQAVSEKVNNAWQYSFITPSSSQRQLDIQQNSICYPEFSSIEMTQENMGALIYLLNNEGVELGELSNLLNDTTDKLIRKAIMRETRAAIALASEETLEKLAEKGLIKVAERAAEEEVLAFIPVLGWVVDIALTAETLYELELMREEYTEKKDHLDKLNELADELVSESDAYNNCMITKIASIVNQAHESHSFDAWLNQGAVYDTWSDSQVVETGRPDFSELDITIDIPADSNGDIVAVYAVYKDEFGNKPEAQPWVESFTSITDLLRTTLKIRFPDGFDDPYEYGLELIFHIKKPPYLITRLPVKIPGFTPEDESEEGTCTVVKSHERVNLTDMMLIYTLVDKTETQDCEATIEEISLEYENLEDEGFYKVASYQDKEATKPFGVEENYFDKYEVKQCVDDTDIADGKNTAETVHIIKTQGYKKCGTLLIRDEGFNPLVSSVQHFIKALTTHVIKKRFRKEIIYETVREVFYQAPLTIPVMFLGGTFNGLPGIPAANRIASWNGAHFRALGQGLNGTVDTLSIARNHLIIGGSFTQATDGVNDPMVSNIVVWNGENYGSLGVLAGSGVGGGAGSFVNALTVFNNELIIGGRFNRVGNLGVGGAAGGTPAASIARLNEATRTIVPLAANSGVFLDGNYGLVYSLEAFDNELIIGGMFHQSGDANAIVAADAALANADVARQNSGQILSQQLENLGIDENDDAAIAAAAALNPNLANAIAAYNADEANYNFANDNVTRMTTPNITKWNGAEFQSIGLIPEEGAYGIANVLIDSYVTTSTPFNTELVLGGFFKDTVEHGDISPAGRDINNIINWGFFDTFTSLGGVGSDDLEGGGAYGGGNDYIADLIEFNGNLIIGGGFTLSSDAMNQDQVAHNIVSWNTNNYNPLGGAGGGLDGLVNAFTLYRDRLIIGGQFNQATDGVNNPAASRIVSWDGTEFRPLGANLINNGAVNALTTGYYTVIE